MPGGIYNKDGLSYSPLIAYEDEVLTVGAAKALTASLYQSTTGTPAILAVVECKIASFLYRLTGSDPDLVEDEGHLLSPGDQVPLWGTEAIKNFRATTIAGGSKLFVTYWR